ncbi:hypothetical protein EDE15_4223 [Edaphobacter aggregans]|uniref:PRTRC system protein F n=1 Tax=Edaphobacter aggregans TaxID=570835 RepID=A0A3R9PCG1_9BACT|nr:hypothetical protein [Edaphobacter aggregans]RSL18633.1 hypothetical protein EDE15_4223 [Edaphobacter aggregans]
MQTGAKGIGNCSRDFENRESSAGDAGNSGRLAALAALGLRRHNPGLVLAALKSIPTSYTYTQGGDTAVAFARSLVELGLGSPEMWQRHNANPSLFIRSAINEWLQSLGAADLVNDVSIDLAIVDELDDGIRQDKGKLFILLETSDGCGFLCVGSALRLLEEEHAGLGRSFYIVLSTFMNRWMEIYDSSRAEYFYERWKESIEMDIEDWDGSEAAFQLYCENNDIHLPDLVASTPSCIREINFHKELKKLKQHIHMLRQHRAGKHGAWIERVLAIARFLKPEPGMDYREIDGIWDDGPLPNWALAFQPHDPITQAFDEEAQCMYESSHAPAWIASLDPTDTRDVRRVLTHIQRLVTINRELVCLSKALERSAPIAGTDQSEFHQELRVA